MPGIQYNKPQGSREKKTWRVFILAAISAIMSLLVIFLLCAPGAARGYIYHIYRELTRMSAVINTWNWSTVESEHFLVRYRNGEEENARLVLNASEQYYFPLVQKYDFNSRDKIPVIIYPTREELNSCFGWPSGERAMGVYWGGVIRILSPEGWINYDSPAEKEIIFKQQGPMAHELTHLLVDYATSGNYPRWFTEGIAQYEEYKLTGFRFGKTGQELAEKSYSLDKMGEQFDSLPNQSLAYRQSLSMVEYVAVVYGEEKLHNIINRLSTGNSFNRVLQNTLGVGLKTFEENWQAWIKRTGGYI